LAFVQLTGVALAYGDRDILAGVNFGIDSATRTALAGANGSGKSTLMKIAAGLLAPDSGEVAIERGNRVAYLPQSGIVHGGATLLREVERAFDHLHDLVAQKEELEERLGLVTEQSAETEGLLLRHHELQERLLASGYYNRAELISQVLEGLGFVREDFERRTSEFSGGWQMRIALAKVLLERPDILLLDEPTNYLDLEARTWLEGYLSSLAGGYLIVSHDRYFLDVTCSAVAELWNGRLKVYRGNYSTYEKRRGEELTELLARYQAQAQEIARTEEFINRFRYNASKAQMVQSRVKQLERLERIEIPESMKRMHFTFPEPPHSGKQVLTLEEVGKSYGERAVLDGFSLSLKRGDKLVIAGRNGAGKSTLMRLIAGIDREYKGNVQYGTGVTTGYFSQDIEGQLDPSKEVIEEISAAAPTALIPRVRDLLGAFLFRGDDVYKTISVLSGGEKSRVALLKLLLVPANLLILDEPTNHLDLQSKDILLEALLAYTGTLVFVSHDRGFIDRLATTVLELTADEAGGPSIARLFPGDYEYYVWKTKNPSGSPHRAQGSAPTSGGALPAASGGAPQVRPDAQPARTSVPDSDPKAGRSPAPLHGTHRIPAAQRKIEREQESLLTKIDALERRHRELSEELASPAVYRDGAKVRARKEQLDANEREQAAATKRWEELDAELAAIARG